MIIRVAHLVSHPIQYLSPLYKELAGRQEIHQTVFYFSDESLMRHKDKEFGQEIEWNISLLDGYDVRWCPSAINKKLEINFFQMPNWDILRETVFGQFDVVWVHGYAHLNTWLAVATACFSGTKILIREEQTLLNGRPWYKRLLKTVMLRGLFCCTYGLYIGENNRRYFKHYGMRPDRLFPARYCVDNDFFRGKAIALTSKRKQLRLEFGIPDDVPVIMFAGKFIEKKQPLLLIEAFACLRAEMPCMLLMVGNGPLRSSMEDLIRRRQIPDVILPGFLNQTEIPRAYSVADIFVLPSSYMETWGLVVNEAMNFSLPIVVTDKVGCAADLVKEGWNGFVVDYQDVDALKNALGRLVRDASLRREFGRRSLELVSKYSIKSCADDIVAACLAVGRNKNIRAKGALA
ncbi:MAG: glycosyltransferase family 4 protein [Syntrophorhabdaceae bacterium]|nr:glycosyltransferase family 4 protein [Syntrophorhabdaceae bacterium]